MLESKIWNKDNCLPLTGLYCFLFDSVSFKHCIFLLSADTKIVIIATEKEMRIGAISSRTASLVVTDLLYYGVYKYDLKNNKNRIYESKHLVSQLLK